MRAVAPAVREQKQSRELIVGQVGEGVPKDALEGEPRRRLVSFGIQEQQKVPASHPTPPTASHLPDNHALFSSLL